MGRKRSVSQKNIGSDVVSFDEAKAIVIRNKELEGSREESARNYSEFLDVWKNIGSFLEKMNDKNDSSLTCYTHYVYHKSMNNVVDTLRESTNNSAIESLVEIARRTAIRTHLRDWNGQENWNKLCD